MMVNRRGLGKGKGSGWKNIVASDSYRHALSKYGIKSSQVNLTKAKRLQVKRQMLPLLAKKTISGYNIVDFIPTKPNKRYQIVYGHDTIKKHRDIILEELKSRNMQYYVVPRESKFLDKETFIKTQSQIRIGDIVSSDREYQIIIDADAKQLRDFQQWLKQKTVAWGELRQLLDGAVNPVVPAWEVIPLKDSFTVPDIRIRNRKRFPEFHQATRISKPLDSNTELVILSVKPSATRKIRRILKGEKAKSVLIQDYKPDKHSFYEFIRDSTR